jgi:hypothetical protein
VIIFDDLEHRNSYGAAADTDTGRSVELPAMAL